MSILRRIAVVLKSYVVDAGEKFDRIAADEEMRKAPVPATERPAATPTLMPRTDPLAADYRYLGLEPGASLEAVESAWRKLASRADPKRFPAGSEEEKRAAEILRSLNEVYSRIREALNPTEGRFGNLEL